MEKIKINKGNTFYPIKSIRPVSEHIMQVVFEDVVPAEWGDITIYTSGDIEATTLSGYDTLYRMEGQTVYLSNDGSVYTPPSESGDVLPPEPYVPTAEELLAFAQASKRDEVSAACEQTIYRGVSVTLEDHTIEHFALTEHDQLNLFGKQAQLVAGVKRLEYHADGQPCRYYSATDMQAIISAAMFHVSCHTTYCNTLNMWIAGCQTAEEVQQIFYGADVPEEYQSEVLKAYLMQIANLAKTDSEIEDNGDDTSAAE